MGRTSTPRYALRMTTFLSRCGKAFHTPMAWDAKYSGKPSVAAIDAWVTAHEDSCGPTGGNRHLGIDPVMSATITDQTTGAVVFEWFRTSRKEPMFTVR